MIELLDPLIFIINKYGNEHETKNCFFKLSLLKKLHKRAYLMKNP